MNPYVKKLRTLNSCASDSGESCYDEQIYCIFLHVVEGIHFYTREIRDVDDRSVRVREKVVMNASLNGVQFEVEGSPAPTMETTIFNSNCIWECDLQAIKRIKTDNRPIKVIFYINNPQVERKIIGNLLLPLRGLPIITSMMSVQNKMFWHKLSCLGNEWRSQKPEVYLMISIVKKSLLSNGEFESLLIGNKKSARSTSVHSPERSNTASMLESQANLYVSQIVQLGLLQVGNNPSVDCTIIEVVLLLKELKNVNRLIKMVSGREELKPLSVVMDFVGNITKIDLKVQENDIYMLNEKLGLRFKTSLKSLRLYFQRIFYLPINIHYNGTTIANYRLDFSKLLPEDSYFNEQRKYTRNGLFIFDRLCKVVSARDPKPTVDYTCSVEILSSLPTISAATVSSNDLMSGMSYPKVQIDVGSHDGDSASMIPHSPVMPSPNASAAGYSTLSTQNMERFIEMNGNEKVAAWCDHVVLSTQKIELKNTAVTTHASDSDAEEYEVHKNVYYKNIEDNVYKRDSVENHANDINGKLSEQKGNMQAMKTTRSDGPLSTVSETLGAQHAKYSKTARSAPHCQTSPNGFVTPASDEEQLQNMSKNENKIEHLNGASEQEPSQLSFHEYFDDVRREAPLTLHSCFEFDTQSSSKMGRSSTSDTSEAELLPQASDNLKVSEKTKYNREPDAESYDHMIKPLQFKIESPRASRHTSENTANSCQVTVKKHNVCQVSVDESNRELQLTAKLLECEKKVAQITEKCAMSQLSRAEPKQSIKIVRHECIMHCKSPRVESHATILRSPKRVVNFAASPSFEPAVQPKVLSSDTAVNTDPVAFFDAQEMNKLHLNTLQELETWKAQQMACFAEELQRKEVHYMQNLEEQNFVRRRTDSTELDTNIFRCEELAQKLADIQEMLAMKSMNKNGSIEDQKEEAVCCGDVRAHLLQIQKTISQQSLAQERDQAKSLSCAKSEMREAYQRKLEELERHITTLKQEMEQQLKSFQNRNEEMRAENERLTREKLQLMERTCEMEAQLGNLKFQGMETDELKKMLDQMRIQNERYLQMEKSKDFYKEQWRRCARRMHKLKLTLLEKEKEQQLGNAFKNEPEVDFIRNEKLGRHPTECTDGEGDISEVVFADVDQQLHEDHLSTFNMNIGCSDNSSTSQRTTPSSMISSSTEFTLSFDDDTSI